MKIGNELEFLEKIKSKLDRTVKYIFLSRGQVIEFSYIDKNDGKDIICAPTQTACRLGCKFCFLSDYDLEVRNLTPEEISIPIHYISKDLGLFNGNNSARVLLVSYMGCGEPLLNIENVMLASESVKKRYSSHYGVVRFAVASLIPNLIAMYNFIDFVLEFELLFKFHLSLHSPDAEKRKFLMPAASPIESSIKLVKIFTDSTGNSAEIHYSLIDDINDSDKDASQLAALLAGLGIPVKILVYNEKPNLDFRHSEKVARFRSILEAGGIKTEFYHPPGWDIGSSCGQFLMDYYEKYNKRKSA